MVVYFFGLMVFLFSLRGVCLLGMSFLQGKPHQKAVRWGLYLSIFSIVISKS